MKNLQKCHEGDDKMNTELINMAMDTGQQIISSPAVQSIVTSLITTLFLRKNENIKSHRGIKSKRI